MRRWIGLTVLFILISTPVIGYTQYYNGYIQLSKVRDVINTIPSKYYRHLTSINYFQGSCYVKGDYVENGYIPYDGYYYYEWRIHNGRLYNTRCDIYLCNLGQYQYNGDEYAILGVMWHELGHHHEFTVLKNTNLSEEYAETWMYNLTD